MNKKVTWIKHINSLNEIYQPTNMQFSFANIIDDKIYQCHQWVKCKDYLHDVIKTSLTGISSNVYGFIFTKNDIKIDLNNIRLLVAQPETVETKWFELRKTFTKSLKYIHHFESIVGEGFSKIEKIMGDDKHKHIWMFVGPKFWLTAPYFISLYAFLIRLGVQKTFNNKIKKNIFDNICVDQITNDTIALSNIKDYIEKVIINRHNIEDYTNGFANSYYANLPIASFHNYMGIVSLCACSNPLKNINNNFKRYILKEQE